MDSVTSSVSNALGGLSLRKVLSYTLKGVALTSVIYLSTRSKPVPMEAAMSTAVLGLSLAVLDKFSPHTSQGLQFGLGFIVATTLTKSGLKLA
jgi:hypothetical protein